MTSASPSDRIHASAAAPRSCLWYFPATHRPYILPGVLPIAAPLRSCFVFGSDVNPTPARTTAELACLPKLSRPPLVAFHPVHFDSAAAMVPYCGRRRRCRRIRTRRAQLIHMTTATRISVSPHGRPRPRSRSRLQPVYRFSALSPRISFSPAALDLETPTLPSTQAYAGF